jgi:hypothetical protein
MRIWATLRLLKYQRAALSLWILPPLMSLTGAFAILISLDSMESGSPEFVSINNDFIAVVFLRENNAVVLVKTKTGRVINSYSAGSVDLAGIDLEEDGIISQTQDQANRLREPDGVVWIDDYFCATANVGDMDGGSRGFSIFDRWGSIAVDSGTERDHVVAMLGHYPDARSGNKGNEPDNVAVGQFGKLLVCQLGALESCFCLQCQ